MPGPAPLSGCQPRGAARALPIVRVPQGTLLYRVYDATWGYDEPNPDFGDTRFAPFDTLTGNRVPSLYAGETDTAALLETVFHAVHQSAPRWVKESHLRKQLLAHLVVPTDLHLVDLRDEVLTDAGIRRDQLVSTPSEHYPCTRLVAQHLHAVYVETAWRRDWCGTHGRRNSPVNVRPWCSSYLAMPTVLLVVVGSGSGPARGTFWKGLAGCELTKSRRSRAPRSMSTNSCNSTLA